MTGMSGLPKFPRKEIVFKAEADFASDYKKAKRRRED
jgi:hypothetical protein